MATRETFTAVTSTPATASAAWRQAAALLTALVIYAGSASAAPLAGDRSATIRVDVQGRCPATADIEAALLSTLPPPYSPSELAASLRVVDQGNRYDVTLAQERRTFTDSPRSCAERARTIAIFATLVLRPPSIQLTDPAPAPTTLQPVDATTSSFNVSALAEAAPWNLLALGGEFRGRIYYAQRFWAFGGGVGFRTLTRLPAGEDASVRLLRVPMDLSVTAQLPGGSGLFAEAGVAASGVWLQSRPPLVQKAWHFRVDPGVRAFCGAAWSLGGQKVVTGVGALLQPWPLHLTVQEAGQVAETPRLWLFLSAGIRFGSANNEVF